MKFLPVVKVLEFTSLTVLTCLPRLRGPRALLLQASIRRGALGGERLSIHKRSCTHRQPIAVAMM
jgi:hypothetical protein